MKRVFIINALPYSTTLEKMLEVNKYPVVVEREIYDKCVALGGFDKVNAVKAVIRTHFGNGFDTVVLIALTNTKELRKQWIDADWIRIMLEADDDLDECRIRAQQHDDEETYEILKDYSFEAITENELTPDEFAVGLMFRQGMLAF